MELLTLDEFITLHLNSNNNYHQRNLWVIEPKFESLYVRYGARYIKLENAQGDHVRYDNTLDIANVTVEDKYIGQGVFTNLISRLRKDYPRLNIYVEIAAPRFQTLLLRLGFLDARDDSFFLKGDL